MDYRVKHSTSRVTNPERIWGALTAELQARINGIKFTTRL
jgi:hypothetical protein